MRQEESPRSGQSRPSGSDPSRAMIARTSGSLSTFIISALKLRLKVEHGDHRLQPVSWPAMAA
jgi:hypothetical protein